jgi:hypothetical protein
VPHVHSNDLAFSIRKTLPAQQPEKNKKEIQNNKTRKCRLPVQVPLGRKILLHFIQNVSKFKYS